MPAHQTMVAIATKDSSNFSCLVVVIDMEASLFFRAMLTADSTRLFLFFKKVLVLFERNAVNTSEISITGHYAEPTVGSSSLT